jgi:rubrerythrin
MANQDTMRRVQVLKRMEETAEQSYDAALGKLHGSQAAVTLQRLRQEHQQHLGRLREHEQFIGGETDGSPMLREYETEVVDSLAKSLDYHGVFGVLRAQEAALRLQTDELLQSSPPEELASDLKRWVTQESEALGFLKVATAGLAHASPTRKGT